jgi:hypothetical protein
MLVSVVEGVMDFMVLVGVEVEPELLVVEVGMVETD